MPLLRGPAAPIAALAALLLAGCTGPAPEAPADPTPRASGAVLPSPTAEPAPSPSPEPAGPPEPPPELERTDELGAAAAAEYFLELYGYTMQTGDVAPWDAMSSVTCQFCRATRELAQSIARSSESFTGAEITPGNTFVHPFDDLVGAYAVDVEFSQTPSEHRGPTGDLVNVSTDDRGFLGVDVTHGTSGWEVLAVTSQDLS